MPLDALTISTWLRLQPDALEIQAKAKSYSEQWREASPPSEINASHKRLSVTLKKMGLQFSVERNGANCWLTRVSFNPGKLVHGHNGGILNEGEVVNAFILLQEFFAPMLADSRAAIQLIPGCSKISPSYWSEIEIPFHLEMTNGAMQRNFQNVVHPSLHSKMGFSGRSFSTTLGTTSSEMQIRIYSKGEELRRRQRSLGFPVRADIVRVEAVLRRKKLLDYLGTPENRERIHESPRLVKFSSADLINAHRRVMDELTGIARPLPEASFSRVGDRIGRLIGFFSHAFGIPVADMLSAYIEHFQPSVSTLQRNRKAAMEEVSFIASEEIQTDWFERAAYDNQPQLFRDESAPRLGSYPFSSPYRLRVAEVYKSPMTN